MIMIEHQNDSISFNVDSTNYKEIGGNSLKEMGIQPYWQVFDFSDKSESPLGKILAIDEYLNKYISGFAATFD